MLGFSPAPLAAGLLLFAAALPALLRADPLSAPAGRSVAPASMDSDQDLSPAVQASPDFQADLADQDSRLRLQDSRLREQDGRLQDQAIRISGVASALDDASAALASNARAQARLEAALEGLRERIESLERKSLSLDEAQAANAVSAASGSAQELILAQGLAALKQDLAANEDKLAEGLKELRSTQAALAKVDSMDELLGMVKRDEESNDEELVEVKQTLQGMEPAPTSENASWWESVASWKYLPAVATGLAIVAVGVAAFDR
jgi:chromosome segregation ATPase